MDKIKLTAEPVNDMEFNKNKNGYSSYYTATMAVKIGNLVEVLTLKEQANYDKDGHPVELQVVKTGKIETLEATGVEIDFTHILKMYGLGLKLVKEEEAENNRIQRQMDYRKSWIHSTKKAFTEWASGNDKDVEVSIPTEEAYMNNNNAAWLRICYRDKETSIEWHYVGSDRLGRGGDHKIGFYNPVGSGYRLHTYKKHENLIKKYVEIMDQHFAESDRKKLSAEKAKEERLAKAKMFTVITGKQIIIEKQWYQPDYGGRRSEGYYKYTFYVKVSDDRKVKIDKDYIRDDSPQTYSLSGIGKLSKDQLNQMISILDVK